MQPRAAERNQLQKTAKQIMTNVTTSPSNPDVVLAGAGVMSATLAVILKELAHRCDDVLSGVNGAAPKFLLNRLHHTDTVRYFAKSRSEPRV